MILDKINLDIQNVVEVPEVSESTSVLPTPYEETPHQEAEHEAIVPIPELSG